MTKRRKPKSAGVEKTNEQVLQELLVETQSLREYVHRLTESVDSLTRKIDIIMGENEWIDDLNP